MNASTLDQSLFTSSLGQVMRSLDYDAPMLGPGIDARGGRTQYSHRANLDLSAQQSGDGFGNLCKGFRSNLVGCSSNVGGRLRRVHLTGRGLRLNGLLQGLLQNSDLRRQRIDLPLELKAKLCAEL